MADESDHLLEDSQSTNQRRRLIRNAIVLNTAIMFLFAGEFSLSAIQSSVHSDGSLGVIGMSSGAFACLVGALLSGVVLDLVGSLKWTLVLSSGMTACSSLSNFYPLLPLFVTGSSISGFANGTMHVAREVYTAKLGHRHADLVRNQTRVTQRDKGKVVNGQTVEEYNPDSSRNSRIRTQGCFFMFYLASSKLGHTVGHLVGSFILSAEDRDPSHHNQTQSAYSLLVDDGLRCGAEYCNEDLHSDVKDATGNKLKNIHWFFALNLGLCVLSTALLAFFLDDLSKIEPTESENRNQDGRRFSWNKIVEAVKGFLSVATNIHILLLVPVFLSSAANDAFWMTDFPKAFVTCAVEMSNIGFVMMWSGVGFAVAAVLFGSWSSVWMRRFSILFSRVLHVALAVGLLCWKIAKNQNLLVSFCILTVAWNFSTGIVLTMSSVLVACLFRENLPQAMANLLTWTTLAAVMVFSCNNLICANVKLLVLIALMIISVAAYAVLEWKLFHGNRKKDVSQ